MVTFGLFFFDVDLDGWQDLFMVNGHVVNEERLRHVPYAQPPQLFRNRGNGTFEEIRPAPGSGLDISIIGRGAAYADYDHDGDLDLLLTANQGPAYLLRNDAPRPNHFLRVVTQGTRSNRDGIGAYLRLHTARRQLSGVVRTGSSYLSQNELPLTFGLEPDERIDRLEITWPSGTVEVYHHLQPDTTFLAREGAAQEAMVMAQPPASSAPATGDDAAGSAAGDAPTAYLALKRDAMGHYQAGRVDAAIGAFEQALQHQPADYIVQQYLIELYWRRGAREQARTLLATMAQGLPEANFFMQFAFHLEAAQLSDLADEVYRQAASLDPQAPEAPYRLGKNALQASRFAAAVAHFQEALQRRPDLRDALQGLGLAYAAQGNTAQAEAQFQAVLRLAPDSAEAYTHLGKLYARTGRLDEAIKAYRTVITLEPDRAQGYHNLGAVLAAEGQSDAALLQFQEALRRDPQYLPARNDLGALYAERGEIDEAIAAFAAVVQINPSWVEAHFNLAMAYAARQDVKAMLHELQETVRLDPRHVDAHLGLGIGYIEQGEMEAAIEQFRTVVSLEPRHARAHSALATLYFQQRQYELARQHAQQAGELGAPMEGLLERLRQAVGPPR
jgi:tetratricopeptide (TPR) repeat protein